jgi:2-isopropylmalate synthase
LHAAAVAKVEHSYQHVPPQNLGNEKRVLISELSGRGNILWKVEELGLDIDLSKSQARELLEHIKLQESKGFQYEGAEASFELLVRRLMPGYTAPFTLVDFVSMVEKREGNGRPADISSQVMLKVRVADEVMHTAADGNGPVNSLDNALRKALLQFYPNLETVRLVDYKARVVDESCSTGEIVRVLIESTDGRNTWNTVGSSENVIETSWMALADSMEYWLVRERTASGTHVTAVS